MCKTEWFLGSIFLLSKGRTFTISKLFLVSRFVMLTPEEIKILEVEIEPAIEEIGITSTDSGIVEEITESAIEVTTVKAIDENKNGVEEQKKQEEQKKALEQKKIEEAKKAKKMAEEKAKQKKILE